MSVLGRGTGVAPVRDADVDIVRRLVRGWRNVRHVLGGLWYGHDTADQVAEALGTAKGARQVAGDVALLGFVGVGEQVRARCERRSEYVYVRTV